MKVILKEDINSLGRAGETVDVRDRYAKRYLLPRKKAVKETPQKIQSLEPDEVKKLFNSIMPTDIERSIKDKGLEEILVEELSKSLGVYAIPIKLDREVIKQITLSITRS